MSSFALNGTVRIAYELSAQVNGKRPVGRPLLLVHGLGYERNGFGPALDRLRAERSLVLLDNRGIGESDVPPGPYTVRELTQDVVSVLDAAGLESVDVAGISLGGMVAQELALSFPARVGRLVLACTTPGVRGYPMPSRTVRLFSELATMSLEEALRRLVRNSLADGTVAARPDLVDEVVRYRLERPLEVAGWQSQAAAGTTFDALDRLGAIEAPTLVLHGDDDYVVDVRNGELLARRIPGAQLERFPGTGHLFFWEQPERFASAVASFLAEAER